uniref:Uncharacterized protein n=1 Tax=Arundo donax TaxID=35708 RepID=A0A0A9F550_ARUDO
MRHSSRTAARAVGQPMERAPRVRRRGERHQEEGVERRGAGALDVTAPGDADATETQHGGGGNSCSALGLKRCKLAI